MSIFKVAYPLNHEVDGICNADFKVFTREVHHNLPLQPKPRHRPVTEEKEKNLKLYGI